MMVIFSAWWSRLDRYLPEGAQEVSPGVCRILAHKTDEAYG